MSGQHVQRAMVAVLTYTIDRLRRERAWHLEKASELGADAARFERKLAEVNGESEAERAYDCDD